MQVCDSAESVQEEAFALRCTVNAGEINNHKKTCAVLLFAIRIKVVEKWGEKLRRQISVMSIVEA